MLKWKPRARHRQQHLAFGKNTTYSLLHSTHHAEVQSHVTDEKENRNGPSAFLLCYSQGLANRAFSLYVVCKTYAEDSLGPSLQLITGMR